MHGVLGECLTPGTLAWAAVGMGVAGSSGRPMQSVCRLAVAACNRSHSLRACKALPLTLGGEGGVAFTVRTQDIAPHPWC